jgi:Predicted membrane protein (DUF2142)
VRSQTDEIIPRLGGACSHGGRHARIATDLMRARTALIAGLVLVAIAVTATLSGSPSTVAGTNGVPVTPARPIGHNGATTQGLAVTEGPAGICQANESLPRDTSAIRLSLESVIGPKLTVDVFSGERLLTSGAQNSGWSARSVTVPISPLVRASPDATICFAIGRSRTLVALLGAATDPRAAARTRAGRSLPGRIRIEYLQAGRTSWWSMGRSVARRMGLGRAIAGTWASLFVLLSMLALALVVCRLIVGETRLRGDATRERETDRGVARILRRVPGAAWMCALVACLNAVCWSVITPPFQVPDEPSHFAYTQVLAENRELPASSRAYGSPEELTALRDLHSYEVRFNPEVGSLSSQAQQRRLERDLAAPLSRRGPGGAGSANSEPPLYYALEAIPYELGSGGSVLLRLQLMRLLSALMAGVTALFAYLFVREALPRSRSAWTVGGLAVALFPLLGFISGGVNPDAMLFAVCAALYYCLARAFRRGLTPRLAIVIGVLTAVGFLTKLNFVGFAPGVILALMVLTLRAARRRASGTHPVAIYGPSVLALSIAVSPVVLYALINLTSNHPALEAASGALNTASRSPLDESSYIWQFYLPRLPAMHNYFPAVFTTRQLWFDGLIGDYGWSETLFPDWAYNIALIPAALIVALCVRELIRRRDALGHRAVEITIYALTGAGVVVLVGTQSYASDILDKMEPYWTPRYLLPMISLWGLVVALAARGAGRRWGPAVATLLVVLLLAHDIFSQLQVIARYYG